MAFDECVDFLLSLFYILCLFLALRCGSTVLRLLETRVMQHESWKLRVSILITSEEGGDCALAGEVYEKLLGGDGQCVNQRGPMVM